MKPKMSHAVETVEEHTESKKDKVKLEVNYNRDPLEQNSMSLHEKLERTAAGGLGHGMFGAPLAVISSTLKVADFGAELTRRATLEMEQERQMRRYFKEALQTINNPAPQL